jgi:hypothetical protein
MQSTEAITTEEETQLAEAPGTVLEVRDEEPASGVVILGDEENQSERADGT